MVDIRSTYIHTYSLHLYFIIIISTVELTASLEPGIPDLHKIVRKIPKGAILPAGNLRALSLLLLEDSALVQTGVKMYYESIANESSTRQKVSSGS